MPDRAYTISPVISEDQYGREVVTDFSVDSGRESAVGRDGQVRGWENDYYEDDQGVMHHRFSETELQEDDNTFDEDEYIGALLESNPVISDAIAWGTDNLPQEWLDQYNQQIDSGSLDDLHEALEWLLQQYAEHGNVAEVKDESEEEESEDLTFDDLSEEEKEAVELVVSDLYVQEPQGTETADKWQYAAQEAEESGDTPYALVAAVTAAFHQGKMTSEEAVSYCIENVPMQELARVYTLLTEE